MDVPKIEQSREHEHTVVIQPASVDDAQDIARIQHDTWLATYVCEEGITREDVESRNLLSNDRVKKWERFIDYPNSTIFVARVDSHVAGYCGFFSDETGQSIRALYVTPEQQRKGVGSRLFRHVLEQADASKSISLNVAAFNADAIEFYKRFGFDEKGPAENPRTRNFPSGRNIDEILMIKKPTA